MNVYIHICIYTRLCIDIQYDTHIHKHMRIHICIYRIIKTQIHIYICTNMFIYIHIYVYMYNIYLHSAASLMFVAYLLVHLFSVLDTACIYVNMRQHICL